MKHLYFGQRQKVKNGTGEENSKNVKHLQKQQKK